ncbi:hypothetical protein Ddc_21558 [Ditylenchus destructor]|nr:hypothetical protein Ddc_21558 [Ditylenchus destructor]
MFRRRLLLGGWCCSASALAGSLMASSSSRIPHGVGWDRWAWALCAVGQVRRDVQLDLLADVHQLQAFDPTWDHAADRQVNRATAIHGAVKGGAVGEFAV